MIEITIIPCRDSQNVVMMSYDWKCAECDSRLYQHKNYARIYFNKSFGGVIYLCEKCFGPICDKFRMAMDPKLKAFA
jgi:hypothetical protein